MIPDDISANKVFLRLHKNAVEAYNKAIQKAYIEAHKEYVRFLEE